jgi:hypothetical protein
MIRGKYINKGRVIESLLNGKLSIDFQQIVSRLWVINMNKKKIKDLSLFVVGMALVAIGLWYSLAIIVVAGAVVAFIQIKDAPTPIISIVKTIEMEDFLKKNQEVINRSAALVIEAAKEEFLEENPGKLVGDFYQKLQRGIEKDPLAVLKMATGYGVGRGWLKLK